jgi:serine protease inhibitor
MGMHKIFLARITEGTAEGFYISAKGAEHEEIYLCACRLFIHDNTNEANLFFSPRGISTVLALLYGGARGETAKRMTDAFDIKKGSFSGMDGEPDRSCISFFLHKAFVDVNDEGTDAAAATGGCFPGE